MKNLIEVGFEGEKLITYFDTIENIREEKINSILK